jgi:tRNA (guanine37-N1)-methyltransferase
MEQGERVLDMFAGVGPFSITLAQQASLVVAVDINPGAVRLLQKNIAMNRARTVLPFLADATILPDLMEQRFDRVIMNHPSDALSFLISASPLPDYPLLYYRVREGQALCRNKEISGPGGRSAMSGLCSGRWHAVCDIIAK